jgi:hypothetical protein
VIMTARSDESEAARPRVTEPAEIIATKAANRARAIDELVREAHDKGSYASRAFWAMVYDFEHAPETTNRRQLAELGVTVPAPEAIESLTDAEVAAAIRSIVEGLALLRVYLLHTDHLSDRELLRRLVLEILDEPIRDAVGTDCEEWIDLLAMDREEADEIMAEFYDPATPPSPRSARRDATLPRPSHARRPDTRGEEPGEG